MEQQFFTNKPFAKNKKGAPSGANIMAMKVESIVFTWFQLTYPEIVEMDYTFEQGKKKICTFSSVFKTNILLAPDKVKNRKTWAREKALEISNLREDEEASELLGKRRKRKGVIVKKNTNKIEQNKKDDIADALLQCQAFKFKYLVGQF